ncbi:hypothetical protein [Leptolyngbya ohadii]|uniref:hypothetical protein n=1 Tax=Leptolyngbya ohadii TaxID=1962290 RepID=UPI000B59CC00|nr:hypothetical protein [Leptolyngbya ohadii]
MDSILGNRVEWSWKTLRKQTESIAGADYPAMTANLQRKSGNFSTNTAKQRRSSINAPVDEPVNESVNQFANQKLSKNKTKVNRLADR